MAYFTRLPAELFSPVFEQLTQHDLATLVRVCRSLKELVEPLLYHSIELIWKLDKPHPPIAKLALSLLRRPELASYIRSLKFLGDKPRVRGLKANFKFSPEKWPSISVWDSVQNSSGKVSDSVISKIHELEPSLDESWSQGLVAGEVDVLVALILARTENLRVLQLSAEFQCDTAYIGDVFKNAVTLNRPSHGFTSLQSVEYGGDVIDDWGYPFFDYLKVDRNQMWPLLRFPSLQRVSAVVLNTDVFEANGNRPSQSHITSLTLRFCKSYNTGLEELLSSTPNLTSLDLQIAFKFERLPSHALFFESSIFVDAIKHVAMSLKHLRLSIELYSISCDAAWTSEDLCIGGFGPSAHSLRFLGNLESLVLPVPALLGWNANQIPDMPKLLPPKLQYLKLTDDSCLVWDYEWNDSALLRHLRRYFREIKRDTNSSLKIFVLSIPQTDEYWFDDSEQTLRAMCQDSGVSCIIER